MKDWEILLTPYKQAVEELKVKLRGLRDQYQKSSSHTPIEFVTGRIKPVKSILEKAKRKNLSLENLEEEMEDLGGLRIVCQFVEDIETVVSLLRSREDFEIVEERDYINYAKPSGYRSYHIIIRYPVQTISGLRKILIELQIRTMAMNFWATIEHSLNYKYSGAIPEEMKLRLHKSAEAASQLDEEMSKIRDEVRKAQQIMNQHVERNE